MGVSSSGHLFYGVFYGEEDPRWPEGEYGREMPDDWDAGWDGWDDWLAARSGVENPWKDPIVDAMPERVYDHSMTYKERQDKYETDRKAWEEAHPEWIATKEAWNEARKRLVDECPVELIQVGHYDNDQYALVLKGTHVLSGGYDADSVDLSKLIELVTTEKIEAAKAWCAKHDIQWDGIGWLLSSSLG